MAYNRASEFTSDHGAVAGIVERYGKLSPRIESALARDGKIDPVYGRHDSGFCMEAGLQSLYFDERRYHGTPAIIQRR